VNRFRVCARRELEFLALGTMDVCVITPLIAALLSQIIPVRPLPTLGLLLGGVLAVHYLARLAVRQSLYPSLRSGLLVLGILVSGLLTIHQLLRAQTPLLDPGWLVAIFRDLRQASLSHDVIVFLAVLFLWWRGLVLAQRQLDGESVAFRFRLGLVMLAVTTVLGGSVLPWPYYYFVFLFFFASLLGIALARAEDVGQQYGGSQSPFGFGWMVTLSLASLVVLLLAAGVAALLTGENIGLLLVPALQVLRIVLFGLVYVLAWVAQVVIVPLLAFFQLYELGRALEEISSRMVPPEEPEMEMQFQESLFTPEQLVVARVVGIVGGVLVLVVLVALSLRRLRARAEQRRGEERESVWEGADLQSGLRDLLRQGRRRLDEAAAALSHSLVDQFFAALTIRRIYAHVGALAAERGYPRAPHETPYEYLPILEQAFPTSREEVACITEAYVAVHYGEVPERPEDLAAVEAAWGHIRGAEAGEPRRRRRAPGSPVADA